jgi:hypothetical protein
VCKVEFDWKSKFNGLHTVRNTQIYTVDSPYLTGITLRLRYRAQPANAVWGDSRCLL